MMYELTVLSLVMLLISGVLYVRQRSLSDVNLLDLERTDRQLRSARVSIWLGIVCLVLCGIALFLAGTLLSMQEGNLRQQEHIIQQMRLTHEEQEKSIRILKDERDIQRRP